MQQLPACTVHVSPDLLPTSRKVKVSGGWRCCRFPRAETVAGRSMCVSDDCVFLHPLIHLRLNLLARFLRIASVHYFVICQHNFSRRLGYGIRRVIDTWKASKIKISLRTHQFMAVWRLVDAIFINMPIHRQKQRGEGVLP